MKIGLGKRCVVEAMGTFAIVFAGCGSVMVESQFPGSTPPGTPALVFGLVVVAMVYALGHVSGAHLNPAVTLGFVVGRHFPKNEATAYCLAQCLGATVAAGMLGWMLPEATTYAATVPNLPHPQAFVWEFLLTFFLMLVVVSVATDTRAVGTMAGLAVGGAVALDAMVGGPVTGASMNPARSLGPALFEGRTDVLWIYVLAPILGACAAALVYEWMRGASAVSVMDENLSA